MNQKIRNLQYEKLLFVDIETVRDIENFDENHPHYDNWAWKQRNKENNQLLTTEENIAIYNNKAALLAEWGKIVCISVGFIKDEELRIKSFTGEEKDILKEFKDLVVSTGRMVAGHNIIGFDVPFMRKRWVINGLGEFLSEKQGNDVYQKPWLLDDSLFDTMVAWKGSGFANTSLEELSMSFKIPTSKDVCHGNQVSEFYYSGRLEEIKTYCEKDVAVVANVLRFWKGESILEPIFIGESAETTAEIKAVPILEKIYKASSIDADTFKEIQSLLKKKKMTKKDRVIVEDMLVKIYINNEMFKTDTQIVKDIKKLEIKNLLDGVK